LFFAGDVKASAQFAWIPFDLTAAAALVTCTLSVISVLVNQGKVSAQVLWMVVLFLGFGVSAMWTEWTPYAEGKAARLFTLALLAAIVPAFTLNRLERVQLFVNSIIASGMLISIGALLQLASGASLVERVTGINSDTISLGRNAGVALVGLYATSLTATRYKALFTILCIPLLLVLVASGSRGPVLFAVAVLAFITIRWSLKSARATVAALVLAVAVAAVLFSGAPGIPQGSLKRIEGFVLQRYDSSSGERVLAGNAAIQEAEKAPFGLGIGGFGRVYNFGSVTDRIHPHNVVLEVIVEQGWLTGAFFVFLLIMGLARVYRTAVREPRLRPFLAVVLFAFGNSLVSGDENDNKVVYALLCIALMTPELVHNASNKSEDRLGDHAADLSY